MSKIRVTIDGKTLLTPRSVYEKAKLKQFREFGYTDLTLTEVSDQIDAVYAGKKFGAGLTVIGMMMEGELK